MGPDNYLCFSDGGREGVLSAPSVVSGVATLVCCPVGPNTFKFMWDARMGVSSTA